MSCLMPTNHFLLQITTELGGFPILYLIQKPYIEVLQNYYNTHLHHHKILKIKQLKNNTYFNLKK